MTLLLTNDEVQAASHMPDLIANIEQGLRDEVTGRVQTVPRINLETDAGFYRLMPVVLPTLDRMGFKAFNGSARAGVRYLIGLSRISDGELLCLLDASYLTAARTGATTGLAARLLLGTRPVEVGVLGSGLEARTNLAAICAATPVRSARVYSPNEQRRTAYASEMSDELAIPVEAVAGPEEVASAEHVLVATNTGLKTDVVALRGEWLSPGAHVSTIGSTMLGLREVDSRTFGRAGRIVVDTEHVAAESGDVAAAMADDCWATDTVFSLADQLADAHWTRNGDITVFKSVGTAMQDIAAAAAVHEVAVARGLGTEVDLVDLKLF